MCDKNCKYNTNKTRRCTNGGKSNNTISSCTWMFNLVAVALLIQHVACAATAIEATTPATRALSKALTDSLPSAFVPTAQLLRRHGDNGSSSSNKNSPTQADSGSRATSRHLSAIESNVGGVSSIVAGDDGVDFAAYANDFNMQAEAAIPEDILDQQHIQDVDATDADSMQYVGDGDGDGDGDEAVEPEADIILAAQKFSTSESSREKEEYYEHNNNNGDNKNKGSNNKSAQLRKTVRKRNNKLKNNADNSNNNNNKNDDRKYDSDNTAVYNDDASMDEADASDITAEEPLALPSVTEARQSFVLTRHPRGQQNHKLIAAEDAQSYEEQSRDVTARHQQFIENLVAEKFNKATAQTVNNDDKANDNMHSNNNNLTKNAGINGSAVDEQSESIQNTAINKGNNMSKQVNNKSEMEYTDDNQPEETAIGDIEDKFRNEEDAAGQQQQQHLQRELHGHQTASIAKQSREGRAEARLASMSGMHVEEDHRQIKKFKRNERASSSSANDHANKNNKNGNHDNNNSHSYKRHHHGELAHIEGEYEAGTFTQMSDAEKVETSENQPRHVQQLQKLPQHVEVADSAGAVAEPQADYSITYFGILTNSSKKRETAFAEEQADADELENTVRNSAKTADIVAKTADNDDAAELGAVHATRNQLQQQQQQQSLTGKVADAGELHAAHSSSFERYKAQRRNSRRYGHKMYKKKYKDYLRHATIASLTAKAMTTAIDAATITAAPHMSTGLPPMGNAFEMSAKHTLNSTQAKLTNDNYTDYYREQQQTRENIANAREQKHAETLRKYARKIEAEKSRGLPASPIFVVGNQSAGKLATSRANSERSTGGDTKHFYEGQVNYYLETADDEGMQTKAASMKSYKPTGVEGEGTTITEVALSREDEERLRAHELSMEHMIAADNNNWYRRVSPVLRNGIKVYGNEDKVQREKAASQLPHVQEQQHHQHLQRQHAAKQHQHYHTHHGKHWSHHHRLHTPPYQHRQQHHDSHQHRGGSGNHHKHHQNSKHYQSSDRQLQQQHPTDSKERKLHDPPSPHAADTQAAVELGMVQTPIPPPSYTKQHLKQTEHERVEQGTLQLGHQITELEELERYYAKWPHLARVQFQLYDEHFREDHPELYPELKVGASDLADAAEDYDDDYESAAELEEAQNSHDEDANLPPYIKKYNRRNKQLLNLLEGTLPPPTRLPPTLGRSWSSSVLQPGPHASSRSAGGSSTAGRIRIDDDYLKEKRKRYHNRDISSADSSSISASNNNNRKEDRHHYQDLFAQQRLTQIATTQTTGETTGVLTKSEAISANPDVSGKSDVISTYKTAAQSDNKLPDEDVSISADTDLDAYAADDGDIDFWQKEIENKSNANELAGSAQMRWQIEKLTTPNPAHAATVSSAPKAAIFRLPSYPAIAGNFIGKPRSRSAQFAPSGGSRGKLAFLAPASSELNGNRWGNIYGLGGENGTSAAGNVGVNGLGTRGSYHKSLSRFSAYKPSVYKTLTAAAAAASTTTTTPRANGDDGMNGDDSAATTTTAVAATPSGFGSDDADGVEGGVANAVMGRTISSFVYHRVIDASPRQVGTGNTGRKQRLPFVAITDRRLETTKKAQLERQKDFEQNHYPMP
ncbi:uncharacterized protein LOC126759960 [Bactrocera neohumeralis]|uniref:uncharacterized protein LOC126759960 n=1 Tax=Bactrocera neohumeralis TaxID=98809 RepID=UPI0021651EA3|nr:uncharacterized protein LOC126759960 [Bactrocera neohumeralis]XP_050331197.1 uncharacterized protein LOC126759960 [Bactrocera neohumeralis]XP_050331198.1 uncharacterized protein LOC126759960 [Bactrocera neohumeralis]